VVVEHLTSEALGQTPRVPPGWSEIFDWNSRPADVPASRWPALQAVVGELIAQRDRLLAQIASLGTPGLDRPGAARPEQSVRYAILHGLHDEACHSGEIWLLRKLHERRAP
jgi:hypothetical protein